MSSTESEDQAARLEQQNNELLERLDELRQTVDDTRELLSTQFADDVSREQLVSFRAKREKQLDELTRQAETLRDELEASDPILQQLIEKAKERRQYIEKMNELSTKTREAAHRAFARGMDYREVAEYLPIARENVWRMESQWKKKGKPSDLTPGTTVLQIEEELATLGEEREQLEKKYKPVNDEVIDLVRQAHDAGVSQQKIETETGIKRSTLRVWLGLEEEWNVWQKKKRRAQDPSEGDE